MIERYINEDALDNLAEHKDELVMIAVVTDSNEKKAAFLFSPNLSLDEVRENVVQVLAEYGGTSPTSISFFPDVIPTGEAVKIIQKYTSFPWK